MSYVTLGLRLRVTNTQDRSVIEKTFDRFPVRIGRNPLNDCQLDSPFVSQFHAVLELHNGNQLMLRDLGSKNGTMLRGAGRVQPHAVVDLGPFSYEFAISSLFFQSFPAEVTQQQATSQKKRATLFLDGPNAAPAAPGGIMPPPLAGGARALSPQVMGIVEQLQPLYDAYRAGWGQFYQTLCLHAGTLDPQSRAQLLEHLVQAQPATAFEPDFTRLAQVFKANLPPSVGASGGRGGDETLALQALKEFAAAYLPSKQIEGADSIVKFFGKLQDTLDVFFKAFIPLRDGYKQFERDVVGGGAAPKRTVRANENVAARTVNSVKEPKELAGVLLDWADQTNEAPKMVEGTFADLMIHQVAMLDGVMRGVKSLLKELSPRSIQELAEKKKVGSGLFGKNYEQLWAVYAERHSDLADEEKEAFQLIFGPQFAQAYNQLAGEGHGAVERLNTGARPAFPTPAGVSQSQPGQVPAPPPMAGQPPLGTNTSGQHKSVVEPPKGNPNAPNPFEWPPPPGPGQRRG